MSRFLNWLRQPFRTTAACAGRTRCRTRLDVEALEDRQLLSASPSAIASVFTQSTEYYQNLVSHAYQQYLGRNPEQAGLNAWVDLMQNHGLSDESLQASFIGSPEYIANHGGTGEAWVRGMYHDLLGREPDPAGLQAWLGALSSGRLTPTQVAHGFAASPEREGIVVQMDYQVFLYRTASPDEVNAWVNAFESGVSNESVVAGFAGSDEYYRNHQSDPAAWLTAVYNDILGRDPDAAGFSAWYAALTGHEPGQTGIPTGTVTVNGYPLAAADVQSLEQQLAIRVLPGQFWYDSVSGAVGMMGQGTSGFVPANLNLPGVPAVPALASYPAGTALLGTTQVLVNGRVLTPGELNFLNRLVAPLNYSLMPGHHYTIQADGTAYDGLDPTQSVNLIQLANQQGHHATRGPLSTYDKTGISVLSDGDFLGVLVAGPGQPDGGPIVE
jgi:hypothetical protein